MRNEDRPVQEEVIPVARSMVVFNKRTGRYETIHENVYNATVGMPYNPDSEYVRRKDPTERRYRNGVQREYDAMLDEVRDVEMAGDLDEATIRVDWSKPGTYGRQAVATIDYTYTDRAGKKVSKQVVGDRTGGWGYDKESSAMARAMDRVPEIKKISYDRMYEPGGAQSVDTRPIPRFKGGAGASTVLRDMRDSGYEVDKQYTGDSESAPDIYTIRRAKVKNMARKAKANSKMGMDKICRRRPF